MTQPNLRKEPYLFLFFIYLIVLLLILISCLFVLKYLSDLQNKSANQRYRSYELADGVRQSSDDLTKMVRQYVATGNPKYRDYYNEILSIREGTSPRPLCYDHIYWDLVIDSERPCAYGEKESRTQLMYRLGFTQEEFHLLDKALSESNALVAMETKAMNAREGLFEDTSGTYTVKGKPDPDLAKDLVFGEEYMLRKSEIMKPLQEFFNLVQERTKKKNDDLIRYVNMVILAAILLSILITLLMLYSLKKISKVTKENEMLLLNILPQPIAERLRGGEQSIAEEFQASVLFADIVGFTSMTYEIGVTKMVGILNKLFREFDDLSEEYKVEKVKTIGDNYMAVAGIPIPASDHAIRLANFALAMKHKVTEFNEQNHLNLQLRIGMTLGTVIAGVIGHKKFIYDVWGDVVNIASRMETTSLPGEIQITEKMAHILEEQFDVVQRHEIEVKGKGMMMTYFLKKKKTSLIPQ